MSSEHVDAIRRETEALERQLAAREAEITLLRAEVRLAERRVDEAEKRAAKATVAAERAAAIIAGIREVTDGWDDLGAAPRRGSEQQKTVDAIRESLAGRSGGEEARRVLRTLAGEAATAP